MKPAEASRNPHRPTMAVRAAGDGRWQAQAEAHLQGQSGNPHHQPTRKAAACAVAWSIKHLPAVEESKNDSNQT